MSYYLNSGIVATGGAVWSNLAIWDEEKSDLYVPAANWTYQGRTLKVQAHEQGNLWNSLWPSSRMASGDPTAPLSVMGTDNAQSAGSYEPVDTLNGGNYRPYFISGYVKDTNGNAIAAVTVKAFRTSDDAFIGQTATDSNGYYQCPTVYASAVNHYIVAYDASGQRAGSTINTLVPTL